MIIDSLCSHLTSSHAICFISPLLNKYLSFHFTLDAMLFDDYHLHSTEGNNFCVLSDSSL